MAPIQNNGANLIFTQVQIWKHDFLDFLIDFLHPTLFFFSVPYIPSDHLSALQKAPPEDRRTGFHFSNSWDSLKWDTKHFAKSSIVNCETQYFQSSILWSMLVNELVPTMPTWSMLVPPCVCEVIGASLTIQLVHSELQDYETALVYKAS